MPKRRRARNEDGTLVTPLSDAQKAALAKGNPRYAARLAKEKAADPGEPPARLGKGGGSVEVVTVTKVPKPRTKAKTAPARRTKAPAVRTGAKRRAPAPTETRESPGLLDRFVDWLSST